MVHFGKSYYSMILSGGTTRHSMSISVGDGASHHSLAANRHLQWKNQKVFIDRIYQVSIPLIITYCMHTLLYFTADHCKLSLHAVLAALPSMIYFV